MHVSLFEILLTFKSRLSTLEYLVTFSLATSSWSNNHETMSHSCGIVQLEHFLNKGLYILNVQFFAHLTNSCQKDTPINDWIIYSRE